MISDETFFAWLDGELDTAERDRVEAAVAADPALAERARKHRAMQASLKGAFDPVMADPVAPPTFGSAPVADLGAFRQRRAERLASFGMPQWAAIAATLVVGFLAGQITLLGKGDSDPVTLEAGRLVAAASLENTLQTRLASAQSDEGTRIGMTFRDKAGAICRTFDDGTSAGLACQRQGDWEIEGLFQSGAGSGDYRMAAGDDPRLAAMIDERIEGEPFDAAQEEAAKNRDWR